jgi:stage II sporulation protein D (peptidoglycan lytic transglycosylase)
VKPGRVLRIVAVTSSMAIVSSCGAPPNVRVRVPAPSARSLQPMVRVQVREGGGLVVREVPLEDYVAATIISEVDPASADEPALERMFEVQAIISRTYVASHHGRHPGQGFDVCATTHCQLYEPSRLRTSKWALLVRKAVDRTRGEILWFGAAPAEALFHADCGGHTSTASEVWGGAGPAYLASARDGGPAARAHAEWTLDVSTAALRDALNADARTAVGTDLRAIGIAERDSGGRAGRVALRGSRQLTVRGETFRDVVVRALGSKSLKSTLFTVHRTRGGFRFSGRGFGHGVGLCQTGALARLEAGASLATVLSFYFPGTQIRETR